MRSVTRERLETERLVCERLTPDHAPELMTLLSDPRVAKPLFASAEPPSEAEMVENLGAKVAHWERFDFGLWLLRDRVTGEMLGRGGLQHTFVGGCDEVEIGWAILPARWGQGLATEMARAAAGVAFDDLRLGELVAFTLPENIASRRVMEKTGFNYERRIVHVGLPHVLYRLAAPTTG
jgi:[ribosomal protein S5]-alanine N-acetyltransferase